MYQHASIHKQVRALPLGGGEGHLTLGNQHTKKNVLNHNIIVSIMSYVRIIFFCKLKIAQKHEINFVYP